jgi:GxxExxY protein
MEINQLTGEVIGAAIEVHKILGPGLMESVYEECLSRELSLKGIGYERQKGLPIQYKGHKIDCEYRIDILVEKMLILELKACDNLQPIHKAQLLTYLKLSNLKYGLLINFNVPFLKDGIKRIAN